MNFIDDLTRKNLTVRPTNNQGIGFLVAAVAVMALPRSLSPYVWWVMIDVGDVTVRL